MLKYAKEEAKTVRELTQGEKVSAKVRGVNLVRMDKVCNNLLQSIDNLARITKKKYYQERTLESTGNFVRRNTEGSLGSLIVSTTKSATQLIPLKATEESIEPTFGVKIQRSNFSDTINFCKTSRIKFGKPMIETQRSKSIEKFIHPKGSLSIEPKTSTDEVSNYRRNVAEAAIRSMIQNSQTPTIFPTALSSSLKPSKRTLSEVAAPESLTNQISEDKFRSIRPSNKDSYGALFENSNDTAAGSPAFSFRVKQIYINKR